MYIKELGLTAILVTHDQTEANALADQIALMEDGELQQFANPEAIKKSPANLFTGTFVGETPMNVFPALVNISEATVTFKLESDVQLTYALDAFSTELRARLATVGEVILGVRPYVVERRQTGSLTTVVANQWLGDQSHITANFAGGSIVLVEHDRTHLEKGQKIFIHLETSLNTLWNA